MGSTVDTELTDQAVRALLQNTLGLFAALNTNIHKNDQMLGFVAAARSSEAVARSEYFTSGAQLLKILEQLVVWKFGSFENLPAFLDFASGYGRFTRFLVHKLPADRIWVSDIQADAVDFQQAEFGVHGFVSTVDPADLECEQTFDTIFVASLFSHLPQATFTSWLRKLCSLLKPGGLLAFSVHGESSLPAGHTMPDTGIWFGEASEIASVDTKDYGTAIVTEAFVRDAIVAATGHPTYRRIQYGLQYHQDIYLVVNEPAPDFSGLSFAYLPHGTVEYCLWTAPGELRLRGWAADMSETGMPLEVQVFIDEQLQNKTAPSINRSDLREHFKDDRFLYAGWECSFHLPDDDPTQIITVKAISGNGVESLLYLGSIESLLPTGKVDLCGWTEPGRLYVAGWAADISETDSPVEVQVFVNEQLRQKSLPSINRPDLREHFKDDRFLYAGWECSFHTPNDDPTQIIMVKAVFPSGNESLLYSGTVASLLSPPDTAVSVSDSDEERREELRQMHLKEELRQMHSELDQRLEYIRHLEAEIERKNAALEHHETPRRRCPWQRFSPRRRPGATKRK
ncbi:MAG: methyltransferase [Chloroflexia bacterium]